MNVQAIECCVQTVYTPQVGAHSLYMYAYRLKKEVVQSGGDTIRVVNNTLYLDRK